VRLKLCGVLEQIGGNLKLKHSSDRLRAILGGWVRDDPTELMVASIYTRQERWPGIGATTRGGRRRRGALAQWVGVLFDADINTNTSTSTPAAPSPAQAPPLPPGPVTRARARELNYIMLLKNEGPEE
jgi:hypothetical protein